MADTAEACAAAKAAAAAEPAAARGSEAPASSWQAPEAPGHEDLPLGSLHAAVVDNGSAADSPLTKGRRRFLCYFMHRHLEFRLPEMEALTELARPGGRLLGAGNGGNGGGVNGSGNGSASSNSGSGSGPAVVWEKPFGDRLDSPFWYMHVESEEVARAAAARSMLAKVVLELWGEADSLEGLREAVAAHPQEEREKWGSPELSFKFVVEGWGCTYTTPQQVELIESMEPCTGFQGSIDLRNPQNRFWLVLARGSGKGLPKLPDRYFFGREVGAADRSVMNTYDLRRRRYLGPTSMDTEMAFLMCNLAKVRKGGLVLDPFVGTGSCLIPAAHLGALTLGADIDIRVIRLGKKDKSGERVNVWTNFRDYGLLLFPP